MPRLLFNRQENLMSSFSTVISVSTLALLTACAAPGGPASSSDTPAAASAHASHHPGAPSTAPMPGMQDRMKAMQEMQEMHDKMMNAKTPAERDALMAEHMKSMQGGMDMMKRMGCMAPMGAGAAMSGGDMAQRQQTMAGCTQMMQMMMEMMGQRMPNAPASK